MVFEFDWQTWGAEYALNQLLFCDWPRVFPVIRSWIPPRPPDPLPTPPLRTKLTARNTNLIG